MANQLFFFLLSCLLISGCIQKQDNSFTSWYNNTYDSPSLETANSKRKSFTASSEPLKIDQIYRSMQGPYNIKEIEISENDLLWLTGYSAQIVDEQEKVLPDGFMCHNNLNISEKEDFPWKVKTLGSSIRLFTLTEGQTAVRLPDGFGIPIPSNQKMSLVSQVLNHNLVEPNYNVSHRITVNYQTQAPLTPLYQQAVFVTKQISGPAGDYGVPLLCLDQHLDSNAIQGDKPNHVCEIDYHDEDFNPYIDDYGRTYTGHWSIPRKREILRTDVTNIMSLPFDTKIHYIGVHVHPFAISLELRDKTENKSLYLAKVQNHDDKIGIASIPYYSSIKGIEVFKNHQYELISTYECNQQGKHTAMATMFLYLHDRF